MMLFDVKYTGKSKSLVSPNGFYNAPIFIILKAYEVNEDFKAQFALMIAAASLQGSFTYFLNSGYGNYWYRDDLKKSMLNDWMEMVGLK